MTCPRCAFENACPSPEPRPTRLADLRDSGEGLQRGEGWVKKGSRRPEVGESLATVWQVLRGVKDRPQNGAFVVVMPWGLAAGLRGLAEVAVVQTADFWTLHDLPAAGSSMGLRSGASLSSARWVRA
jgi:hypothetical protein